jgi:putative DNA primase/helicase
MSAPTQFFEQAMLGAVLLAPSILPRAKELIHPTLFANHHNGTIWETFEALQADGEPIDVVTVCDRLQADGKLTDVGGHTYVAELMSSTASAANWSAYAERVNQAHQRRRAMSILSRGLERLDHSDDPDVVIAEQIDAMQLLRDALAPSAGDGARVELIRACDVTPEPVAWLWDGWLALGKLHILGGAPGTGKTTIAIQMAATVTVGGRWPDGSQCSIGNVVIWSGEDDPKDTLIPRLMAAGADLNRAYFVGDVRDGDQKRAFDPARDMVALQRIISEVGEVRLLIVDPIVSAITGDGHKNTEVRRALQPLANLAAAVRCALVGNTHFTKGTSGREPLERITGSIAFGAVARVVFVAAKGKAECAGEKAPRLLLRAKSNIGPDDGGFGYELCHCAVESVPGIYASAVVWGAPLQGTARELLALADATDDDGEGGKLSDAKAFLADLLGDGPMPASRVQSDSRGAGYSDATIRRAFKALGCRSHKVGMKDGWEWSLPQRCSENPEDAQQIVVSAFGNIDHLRGESNPVEVEF